MDSPDVSSVGVALPSVEQEFGLSDSSLRWLPSGCTLVYGGSLLLGGCNVIRRQHQPAIGPQADRKRRGRTVLPDLSLDEMLSTTRAVRKCLDLVRAMERSVLEECLNLALQAPMGRNRQGWDFVVVTGEGAMPRPRRSLPEVRGSPPGAGLSRKPGSTYSRRCVS